VLNLIGMLLYGLIFFALSVYLYLSCDKRNVVIALAMGAMYCEENCKGRINDEMMVQRIEDVRQECLK
jgi:hypothetical protein